MFNKERWRNTALNHPHSSASYSTPLPIIISYCVNNISSNLTLILLNRLDNNRNNTRVTADVFTKNNILLIDF
ncbi:hypothetical protein TUM4636_09510 [Shewanella glacialipiscicola]|uniref:Uncharacterized protein n=1 Tax=Shewanella glacialipiscicola TaxID=614069 RepID=A0ABQ6J850_9GAMM|nr:hypothetical protein TUM4636_09510 [Shewanella glacialipiscicola]GMA83005.1 hypothetical protein GCM10025855_25380 [Shewanella glacialipiscicola]